MQPLNPLNLWRHFACFAGPRGPSFTLTSFQRTAAIQVSSMRSSVHVPSSSVASVASVTSCSKRSSTATPFVRFAWLLGAPRFGAESFEPFRQLFVAGGAAVNQKLIMEILRLLGGKLPISE